MAQANVAEDEVDEEIARQKMQTTHGHERRELDAGGDDHPLAGMSSERQAPIESVAKNVVNRYDQTKAFLREYIANSHTACIQRAKLILRENDVADDVNMHNVREVLDIAAERFGYEPVITVKYNRNPEARWTLKIEDNGIGIKSQTAYAIRDIGLSGWHMDGSSNGQFGQGTMAGFLPVDTYGEFHMTTKSAETGENYQVAWKLTDLNRLKGTRDRVGTTFTWPTFTDDAHDIDFYDAVREYSAGMIIPVLYEDYDEDGNETGKSDEFLPSHMEDKYPDDALVISYEDDFGRVVWSPEDPEGWNTSLDTYCGYQPINRNESGFSKNSYEMPSGFDFRLKDESGPIIEVNGSMDSEFVGKTPVSRRKYRSMLLSERSIVPEIHVDDKDRGYVHPDTGELFTTDADLAQQSDVTGPLDNDELNGLEPAVVAGKYKGRPIVPNDEWDAMDDGYIGESFVAKDQIPDDADTLQAMEPTDDRDRFERAQVAPVLRRYSEKLWDVLRDETAAVFEDVEQFNDIFELEGNRQALFHKGVSRFGPSYSRAEPSSIQHEIEDELGVTLSLDVCRKIDVMKKNVSLAPRNTSRPQKKQNRRKKPVWKVLRKAQDGDKDGDVYMGWRISKQKANLVWELNEDNQVVQTSKRELFGKRLGWKDLTDLPTKQFDKHFDVDFEEDFLDSWDKDRQNSSSSAYESKNTLSDEIKELSYNDKRAMKRSITVRRGTGADNVYDVRGENLYQTLDGDDDGDAQFKSYDIEKLVIYRSSNDDISKGAGSKYVNKNNGVFYAVVPNYVYDYLITAAEAYSEDEYLDHLTDAWLDYDWSDGARAGRTLETASERDVLLFASDEMIERFKEYDAFESLRDEIANSLDDVDSIRSITIRKYLDEYYEVLSPKGCYDVDPDEPMPSIVALDESTPYHIYADSSLDHQRLFYDCVLPDLDRSAPEWDGITVDITDDEAVESMIRLQEAGGFVSTDDDFECPIADNEHTKLDRQHTGKTNISKSNVLLTKTLERLEDAGGWVTDDE